MAKAAHCGITDPRDLRNVNDTSLLPDLLQQRPKDEMLESVTIDGAYDTQPAHAVVMTNVAALDL